MTRTAPLLAPSLTPCVRDPGLWDSSDNTQAIEGCRRHCPRRFACAQEALDQSASVRSGLAGVIAGVAIPDQNAYGTSKAHRAALRRLEAVAQQGRRLSATVAAQAS